MTIDAELMKWIAKQIQIRRFANNSHAVEYAIAKLVEEEAKTQA